VNVFQPPRKLVGSIREEQSMSRLEEVIKVFLTFFACALALLAQVERGVISGTVRDPSGAGVVTASVEVTNTETGVSV
jgi:hypothetical protein